jgi:hypothetical protein
MRIALLALVTLSLAFAGGSAFAAPCRDAHGKFMKCMIVKPVRCRDAHGRFAKCGMPGTHPA